MLTIYKRYSLRISILFILCLCVFGYGCSYSSMNSSIKQAYHDTKEYLSPKSVEINQGNIVDENSIEKLEIGMPINEVKKILGTNVLFDDMYCSKDNRCIVYTNIKITNLGIKSQKTIFLQFSKNNKLIDFSMK